VLTRHDVIGFFRKQRLRGAYALLRSALFLFVVGVFLAQISEWLPLEEQFKRAVARIYAPALDWTYPRAGRDAITIAQVDDDDLAAYREDWPIGYRFHRRRLLNLTLDRPEGKRPRAIFVDVLFLDPRRQDPAILADVFCRMSDAGIGVFLASLNWTPYKYPRTTELLKRPGDPDGAPCGTEVSVARNDDIFDEMAWAYNLRSGEGKREAPMDSAALAMFRHLEPDRAARVPRDAPLALIWGTSPHPFNPSWMRRADDAQPVCRDTWAALVILKGLWTSLTNLTIPEWEHKRLCPYTRVLPMRALQGTVGPEVLDDALAGRAVIYGLNLQSAGDVFRAPLHGPLAGAHLHAMALDNMISFSGATKRAEGFDLMKPRTRGTLFTLSALAVLALLMAFTRHFRPRFEEKIIEWWTGFSFRRGRARKSLSAEKLRARYFRCVRLYRTTRLMAAAILYLSVALLVAYLGYEVFGLGPLTWIEYALFLMLAHFIGAARYLENWVSSALRRRQRLDRLTDAAKFQSEAKQTLIADSAQEHEH
jgi:hypothetical protein